MKKSKELPICDEGFIQYIYNMSLYELMGFVLRHPDYLDYNCTKAIIEDRYSLLGE